MLKHRPGLSSCGPNGLVSLLLLATVARRRGSVATDLHDAADHAEIWLAIKLRTHVDDVLRGVAAHLESGDPLWV
ncbi:MAG TPA: hypothetical protein VGD01_14615 [Candidatus Elarobacter sp.]